MDLKEVGLRVKKAPGFYGLVGVEVVFLSEFCEGEFFTIALDPIPKSGHGYFCLVSSAHGSYCHVQGVTHIIIGECGKNESWRVGCVTELAIRKAFLAVLAEVQLCCVISYCSGAGFNYRGCR